MHILQLSEAEIAELNYERFQNPDPLVQKRLQSLYLSGVLGYSKTEAGKILGRHRNTVSTDLSCYQTGGMETLKQVNYGTNKSELAQHSTLLKTRFEEHPPISVKEAAQRIKELTGIERSPSQIHTFIKKQLGMKFVKTGHIPAKADPERQELWLENKLQPALDLAEQGLAHVSFMDAAHFVLAPFLYFLWCFERVFIKAPAGRKRLNVFGVNALTKEVYFISNQGRINANVIADLLHQLRIYYADMKPIYIVLDNARYQYCQFVKYVVAWQFNIHLIFLPPYSPNNKYH
ncbi:MAG: IS630 family transposase [Bacteroidota bacterium]